MKEKYENKGAKKPNIKCSVVTCSESKVVSRVNLFAS